MTFSLFPEKQQKQSGLNYTLKGISHTAIPDFTWVLAYRKGCDWTLVSPSSSPGRPSDPSPHPLPPPPPVSPDLRCRSSSGWTALYQFCGPLSGVSTGLRASSWPWETPCTLFTMFTAFAGSWSNLCMVVIVKLVPKLSHLFRSPETGKHTCRWFLNSQIHTHTPVESGSKATVDRKLQSKAQSSGLVFNLMQIRRLQSIFRFRRLWEVRRREGRWRQKLFSSCSEPTDDEHTALIAEKS